MWFILLLFLPLKSEFFFLVAHPEKTKTTSRQQGFIVMSNKWLARLFHMQFFTCLLNSLHYIHQLSLSPNNFQLQSLHWIKFPQV